MNSNKHPLSTKRLRCFWAFTNVRFCILSQSYLRSLVFVFTIDFRCHSSRLITNSGEYKTHVQQFHHFHMVFITNLAYTCYVDCHLQLPNEQFVWTYESKQSCIRGTKWKRSAFQRSSHCSQAVWFKWAEPKRGARALVIIIPIAVK